MRLYRINYSTEEGGVTAIYVKASDNDHALDLFYRSGLTAFLSIEPVDQKK